MLSSSSILGIDVDGTNFVVFLESRRRRRTFKNCPSGFKELDEWLKAQVGGPVLACMEATGRYGEKLAENLHRRGNEVAVVNPSFIARHKEALNQNNKTDPCDAEAIADYARCFRHRIRLWKPMDETQKKLRDVLGQIDLLKKTITAFSNRGGCGLVDENVVHSNEETVSMLRAEIESLQLHRDELFEQLPALQEIREIVDQVPGIGPETSDALAAKVNFDDFANGRDLAIFLGTGSSEWRSGKQKRRGKQKKAGDPHLRSLLRQGAVSAMRTSFYRPFVERLRKKGLSEGKIVGAVARKMVLIAYALVRSKKPFDRYYRHPLMQKEPS